MKAIFFHWFNDKTWKTFNLMHFKDKNKLPHTHTPIFQWPKMIFNNNNSLQSKKKHVSTILIKAFLLHSPSPFPRVHKQTSMGYFHECQLVYALLCDVFGIYRIFIFHKVSNQLWPWQCNFVTILKIKSTLVHIQNTENQSKILCSKAHNVPVERNVNERKRTRKKTVRKQHT